jgi:hypothetical protein
MVHIFQHRYLRLVVFGIPLQTDDPLFHRAAKARADFEPIVGGTIGDHGMNLEAGFSEAEK